MTDQIKNSIARMEELDHKIQVTESHLKELKKQYDEILERELVTLLQDAGLGEVKTTAGDTITVKTSISVSQTDKAMVCDWVESAGYKEAIKTALEFAKGVDTSGLESEAKKEGLEYSKTTEVNTLTLKSILTKFWESEGYLPDGHGMNITTFTRAVVKKAKE